MILGAMDTGLFVVAGVADAASSLLKASAPIASAVAVTTPASSEPTPSGRYEEDLPAELWERPRY